jgi:hypothetical protein
MAVPDGQVLESLPNDHLPELWELIPMWWLYQILDIQIRAD